ncbi:hypothetical protein L1S32_05780 [Methanogenium sp. S4BF]|uniref:hypothetical protein n=1 Tax=Methanogenium sp. S4BF TaxID=1789226 RepID=UPI0024159B7F|nr:hypothetical protein [Methanogenium sp. S4BF]WFN35611.1 hypothetical protein L1S32_05780 [Methanogenium sp. S4BF]
MNTDPVVTVHPAILRFERTIRCLTDAEMTGIFSAEGALVLTLRAVDTGRGFFTVIPEEMTQQIRGCILTHNHPSDRSFTRSDLEEASLFGLKEIRVVGRTGLYSMKPGAGGWPAPQVIADCFSAIEADPALQAETAGGNHCPGRFRHGEEHRSCTGRVWSESLCERLALALNLIYRKSLWEDACHAGE